MLELKNPIKELWHGFPVPLWRSTHPAEEEDDDEAPGDGTASPAVRPEEAIAARLANGDGY